MKEGLKKLLQLTVLFCVGFGSILLLLGIVYCLVSFVGNLGYESECEDFSEMGFNTDIRNINFIEKRCFVETNKYGFIETGRLRKLDLKLDDLKQKENKIEYKSLNCNKIEIEVTDQYMRPVHDVKVYFNEYIGMTDINGNIKFNNTGEFIFYKEGYVSRNINIDTCNNKVILKEK